MVCASREISRLDSRPEQAAPKCSPPLFFIYFFFRNPLYSTDIEILILDCEEQWCSTCHVLSVNIRSIFANNLYHLSEIPSRCPVQHCLASLQTVVILKISLSWFSYVIKVENVISISFEHCSNLLHWVLLCSIEESRGTFPLKR